MCIGTECVVDVSSRRQMSWQWHGLRTCRSRAGLFMLCVTLALYIIWWHIGALVLVLCKRPPPFNVAELFIVLCGCVIM